jgi:hypothetical protein
MLASKARGKNAMPAALDSIDIHGTHLYVERGYPWKEWELLRREAPVYWYEREDIEPFWAITRHADVLAISRDPSTFINGGRRLRLASIGEEILMTEGFKGFAKEQGWDPGEPPDMVFMDDPRHRKFRLLTSSAFTPGRLRALEPRIEKLATGFAAEFAETLGRRTAEAGSCDFVREYSVKLPLAAIGDLMGLPPGDWMRALVWTNAMLGDIHPSFQVEGESPGGAARRAVLEMRAYFDALMEERRDAGAGSECLVDMLLRARLDGEPLTDQQLHGYLLLLTAAGNESRGPSRRTSRFGVRRSGRATRWGCSTRRRTETRTSSKTRIVSTSHASPTTTWPSGTVRTSAWAPTWRASSFGRRSAPCCRSCPGWSWSMRAYASPTSTSPAFARSPFATLLREAFAHFCRRPRTRDAEPPG